MNVCDRQARNQRRKQVPTFTITDDNNITAYAAADQAARSEGSTATRFDSEEALAKAGAEWPLGRFVEIWNSIAGNAPVKKFQDRSKAVARIWKAIQSLAIEGVAARTEPAKPVKADKGTTLTKKDPIRASAGKQDGAKVERHHKKAEVLAMMKRAKGVTLTEIMAVTGWKAHTVRGFVSILGSKGDETIDSTKNARGERVYLVAK